MNLLILVRGIPLLVAVAVMEAITGFEVPGSHRGILRPSSSSSYSKKKMAATSGFAAVLAIASLLCLTVAPTGGALQVGFYKGKCNRTDVEATVKSIVAARFARDRTIVPALLRLHFHDCFVRVRMLQVSMQTLSGVFIAG
ncbi:hypothetical protein B296_00021730 [Ensete ventricosum]|uniref:Plant heme peroxidase family profile domain-containing protein n=1 Tax=Ensete ventricosum TaxID=4639 RepID=A0A427AF68_ENSVE|nr:hypothetical protein B296_00021730 [Ensete ventricosum]